MIPPAARSDLAPARTRRVGINYGNAILVQREQATGEFSGVAIDLAQELALRIGVPLEFVTYDAPGKIA